MNHDNNCILQIIHIGRATVIDIITNVENQKNLIVIVCKGDRVMQKPFV